MRPLLDTNLLVHNIRQDGLWQAVEDRYGLRDAPEAPFISIVTGGEIRSLALQSGWGVAKQERMEDLLDYYVVIPLPFSNIVEVYAEIDDYSRRDGVTMGKSDLWIAATASVTGARLLTTDKDFDHLHDVFLSRDWLDPAL